MGFTKSMLLAGGLLCSGIRAPLGAQRVSGIVRDTGSSMPLSGAVVSALDAGNTSLGRAITDGNGRYFLEVTAAASKLRVVRIGFQPLVLPLPGQRGASMVVDAWMTKVATLLTSLSINDDRICSTDRDRSGALALWEQARAGLLASVVAREKLPATSMAMKYERLVDLGSGRVLQQRGVLETRSGSRPFVAAESPEKLAEDGYLEENGSARRFKGPDADVLLDESFARTHCFSVRVADSAHADAVGLAFEPVKGRDNVMDIRGTLWLASGTPALRTLEYRYTGGDPAWEAGGASGIIHFRSMPNGVVFVDEWTLHLPVLVSQTTLTAMTNGRLQRGRAVLRPSPLHQVDETGGLVLSATWPDEQHWDAPLVPLAGTVFQSGTTKAVAGALVIVPATGDTLTADSSGHFSLSPMVPGHYALDVADTTYRDFLRPRVVNRDVTVVAGEPLDVHAEVPSIAQTLTALCFPKDTPRFGGLLHASPEGVPASPAIPTVVFGTISDLVRPQKLPSDVRVTGAWMKGGSTTQQETQTVSLDERGRFSICGVPQDQSVLLTVSKSGAAYADTSVVLDTRSMMMSFDWKLNVDALSRVVPQKTATLRGHVTREGLGTPIAGAMVWFPALDRRATSDANGAFRIDSIPAGGTIVQVRSVSSQLKRDTITIAKGADLVRDFALASQAAMLDTIRTVASSIAGLPPGLRGFEERRQNASSGYFISDSALRRFDGRPLSGVILGRVGGISLIPGRSGATYIVSSRKQCSGPALLKPCSDPNCFVTVYLDGTQLTGDLFDANRMEVYDLAGVEFYPSGGAGPSQFNATNTGCGTLLLWSRVKQ